MRFSKLHSGLTHAGVVLANAIQKKVSGAGYPKEIAQAVKLGIAKVQDGQGEIAITIDLDIAPMAAAFEYGSGEHATIGEKKRYRIPEAGKVGVSFPKERWPQYAPPPDAPDVFYFPYVMHPGIEAKPYIDPAIEETADQIAEILADAVVVDILSSIDEIIRVIK